MNDHEICGKCGAADLHRIASTPSHHSHIVVGQGLMHTVSISMYVCTDCGHVEEWINGKEDLRRLKEDSIRAKNEKGVE